MNFKDVQVYTEPVYWTNAGQYICREIYDIWFGHEKRDPESNVYLIWKSKADIGDPLKAIGDVYMARDYGEAVCTLEGRAGIVRARRHVGGFTGMYYPHHAWNFALQWAAEAVTEFLNSEKIRS